MRTDKLQSSLCFCSTLILTYKYYFKIFCPSIQNITCRNGLRHYRSTALLARPQIRIVCPSSFHPLSVHHWYVVIGGFVCQSSEFFCRKLLRNFGKSRVREIVLFGARPRDVFRRPSKGHFSAPVRRTFFGVRPKDVFRCPSKRRFSVPVQKDVFRHPSKGRFRALIQMMFFNAHRYYNLVLPDNLEKFHVARSCAAGHHGKFHMARTCAA